MPESRPDERPGTDWDALRCCLEGSAHPERRILGKPHPSRAAQFKPFAALKGLEELLAQEAARHGEPPR